MWPTRRHVELYWLLLPGRDFIVVLGHQAADTMGQKIINQVHPWTTVATSSSFASIMLKVSDWWPVMWKLYSLFVFCFLLFRFGVFASCWKWSVMWKLYFQFIYICRLRCSGLLPCIGATCRFVRMSCGFLSIWSPFFKFEFCQWKWWSFWFCDIRNFLLQ